ncbi:MAG: PIN domain-containing protein [Opitutales bacterium]|nr:PIN domain-containing protein [Opitutales bacterium]
MPNAFVDTNILVYAAEESVPTCRKTGIARELLLQPNLHLSIQVLNEFTANARHPGKLNLSVEEEEDWLSQWLRLTILPLTIETYLNALRIHLNHGLSHWDSLIVASAMLAKCGVLYTEDLNPGQEIQGVRVINPFA